MQLRHEQVKELKRQGLSTREIAAQLKLSAAAVSSLSRYQPSHKKAHTRHNSNRRGGIPDVERYRHVMLMREHGMTFEAIGAVLGCTKQAAHQMADRAALVIAPAGADG